MARILVIDDEVAVRNAIRLILRHKGHHGAVAECGQRGVEAIEAFAFDAVIVDIFMPGMDGFQTIGCLRQCAPKVAIIAMSGYAFREAAWPVPDFLKMACDLGATCCLRKAVQGLGNHQGGRDVLCGCLSGRGIGPSCRGFCA